MNPFPRYRAVVFGATSALATETLRALLAEQPAELLLFARDAKKLHANAADFQVRGATVTSCVADLTTMTPEMENALQAFGQSEVDLVLIAHGTLPDQEQLLRDSAQLERMLAVNFVSPVILATRCASLLERQQSGTLAVFGSVAGDRGRASNFLYGSAKAGLEAFCEGLRHRFAVHRDLRLVLLKPGMTDTPMTAHLPKGALFSPASKVGALAWRAIRKGRPVAYLPSWWAIVMCIIRALPRMVFYRTKL